MKTESEKSKKGNDQAVRQERGYHGRIFTAPDQDQCLNPVQLHRLEQSFREWTEATSRSDIRMSRRRILLIFLLIRYTGAKLSEVLGLDPFRTSISKIISFASGAFRQNQSDLNAK